MKYSENINPYGRPWKVVIYFLAIYLLYYVITETTADTSQFNNDFVLQAKRFVSPLFGLCLLPSLWFLVRSIGNLWGLCACFCIIDFSVIFFKVIQYRKVAQLVLSELETEFNGIWIKVIYKELLPSLVYWLPILGIIFYYWNTSKKKT